MIHATFNRRTFLTVLASGLLQAVSFSAADGARLTPVLGGSRPRGEHPEPRPGIDASRVLAADAVPEDVRHLYDGIREIPQIADGIRCQCGCADLDGFYSLLTCYEENGMAQHCAVCQGVAELVIRLHGEGRSLDAIRAAVDSRSW